MTTQATPQSVNPLLEKFRLRTKTSYYLSGSDFEAGTHAVYGKRIELLESPNDTTHEYSGIDGTLSSWEEKELDTAVEDGDIQCWNAAVVLNDLVRRGVLPAGDYFIRVSW
jgi:hypothetical protein